MSALLVMLVKSYSVLPVVLQRIMKKDLFWHFLRSLLIMTYLITLNLEKGVIVLEKSLEKVLNCGSKICINPPNRNPHF